MSRFRVFVGAPSKTDLQNEQNYYHWQTIPSKSIISETSVVILLPATLNAASRRVSRIYQNIIFDEEDEERHCDGYQEGLGRAFCPLKPTKLKTTDETIISWPPTVPKDTTESRIEITMPSFLSRDPSSILAQTPYETQETQNSTSFAYSDASSIARFPAFQFNLHSLTALSTISASKASRKVSVLLAALEVEGPDTIRIKKGVDMGKEVTILKMILGDEDGNVCKLTAWREVAESWGGLKEDPIVKRGDVLLIESKSSPSESS